MLGLEAMAGAPDPKELLHTIIEGLGQPFYAVDGDWRIHLYNSDAARHFGKPASEMIGRRIFDVYPQDLDAERGRILKDAMAGRKQVTGETMSLVGRYVSYVMFPLGDGLGILFRDVTDRRRAEELRDKAEEALRKRTAELEAVLETIPTAVWFTSDPQARSLVANRRAAELLRTPSGKMPSLSAPLSEFTPDERPTYRFHRDGREVRPEDLPLQRAARGEEVRDELLEAHFDNGDRRLLLMRAAPLRSSQGTFPGAVCAAADVTERHRHEDHLKLLLDELNHRVKNTLAIVQSIANLTFKDTDPAARADFEQRLLTLSGVHGLLIEQNWQGAELHAVMRAALKPHLGGARERLTFAGEDFRIKPKSAVAVSMALHELGTNAAKYGALSSGQGSIAVRWTTDGGRFRMRWQESDGPPVAHPQRRGFGSLMIERGLAGELNGEVRIDYRPAGVVCTIDAPLDSLREAP
jgi:two-component sensor histidine kinase